MSAAVPQEQEEAWAAANAAFLGGALAWLRGELARLSGAAHPPAAEPDWAAGDDARPALLRLAALFGLTAFEAKLLLLSAGVDLDPALADLCRKAQGGGAQGVDEGLAAPTFALALALFSDATWEALSPHGALRLWSLVDVAAGPSRSLTASPLRCDERIVHYLKGLNEIDMRLAALLQPPSLGPRGEPAPSQRGVVAEVVAVWRGADRHVPVLTGHDRDSAGLVAEAAALACGLQLCRMSADLLPASPADGEAFERLWRREQRLLPYALLVEVEEAPGEAPARRLRLPPDGAVVLAAAAAPRANRPLRPMPVAKPTRPEQEALWVEALGEAHRALAGDLAAQFTLSVGAIRLLARRHPPGAGRPEDAETLWDAAREMLRPAIGQLARRVPAAATWDDLVLPEACSGPLRAIAAQLRHRRRIHDDWGFAARTGRGLGITALFAGESGTGKTLAAEVLAASLRLDLYLVDLSGVVSKYIGETEKNLRRLFDAAEESGSILFFDEADALFGKRSEVRDSHDRYANIEVNYLLQRMEAYRGLAILATNLRASLDPAFLRRLRFVVTFPYPGPVERQAIWKRAFPPAAAVGMLDWAQLGRLNLTGGNIGTVALNGAFLASAEGSRVEMRHVLEAARAELVKLDRPFRESELTVAAAPVGRVA